MCHSLILFMRKITIYLDNLFTFCDIITHFFVVLFPFSSSFFTYQLICHHKIHSSVVTLLNLMESSRSWFLLFCSIVIPSSLINWNYSLVLSHCKYKVNTKKDDRSHLFQQLRIVILTPRICRLIILQQA
jgi:hypothetical protein